MEISNSDITRIFLKRLYGQTKIGHLCLWTKQGLLSFWYPVSEIDKAAEKAIQMAVDRDVYFMLGLQPKPLGPRKRGQADEVIMIPGVWMDIDVQNPEAHKTDQLPPTFEAAIEFVNSAAPKLGPPSITVNSGNGLHAYWLFDKPLIINTPEAKREAQARVSNVQGFIISRAKADHGWKLDNTSDLVRVLRVPGTNNHKQSPPQKVTIYLNE